MKIVLTGGATGGHFYPLIAVAEAIHDIVAERHLVSPRLYYIAPTPYDEKSLFDNEITFIKSPAGKMRRYASIMNFIDPFKTLIGTIRTFFVLFSLYPDAIFSKGGFASVPTVLAARMLGIPVIIHESDAKPGRANLLAAKSAYRIAVAFPSAAQYFPPKTRGKIAETGIPVRKTVLGAPIEGAGEFLGLSKDLPTVLILGGSSGSTRINETILQALPDLVGFGNVIHQTGQGLFTEVEKTARAILGANPNADRYKAVPFMSADSLRQAATLADVVVSRAGATAITEIALWGKPAILIPIPEDVSHDQRTNAYAYAHTGAAEVIEEANLTPHVLASEVRRITSDVALKTRMSEKAAGFASPNGARIIAEELLSIGLMHEPIQKV